MAELKVLLHQLHGHVEQGVVVLRGADVARILERYLAGELSKDDVEAWAGLLEHRDDVDIAEEGRSVVIDFLFELATPEINRPLTKEIALEYLDRLKRV